MSSKIGARLNEVIDFDFSKPHSPEVREALTVKLCGQFLEPLSNAIEKSERKEDDDVAENGEKLEDKYGVMEKLQKYLQGAMTKELHQRNMKCNAVLPYINTAPVDDWEKRDLPIVASFGFPKKVPNSLLSRKRSNKLFKCFMPRLHKIFPGHEITDVEHNESAKVPYLLFYVDDVSVILRISMKPFCCSQFLSKDIVEIYEKFDDRFITIATYFHNFLKAKVITKRDQKKQKSVIPKLCSIQMMLIHCFKHYNILPEDLNLDNLSNLMSNLTVSSSSSAVKNVSLGTLFFLFLDYYLEVVDLETDYIEISTGDVVEKESIGLSNKNILSISDIFDDHIPGERVNDILIFKKILKACFLNIQQFLNNRTGDLLNNLRVIPFRPRVEL